MESVKVQNRLCAYPCSETKEKGEKEKRKKEEEKEAKKYQICMKNCGIF